MDLGKMFIDAAGGFVAFFLGAPAHAQTPPQKPPITTPQQSIMFRGFDLARIPDYMRCEATIAIQSMPRDGKLSLNEHPWRSYDGKTSGISYNFTIATGEKKFGHESQTLTMKWQDTGVQDRSLILLYDRRDVYGNVDITHLDSMMLSKDGFDSPRIVPMPVTHNFSSVFRDQKYVGNGADGFYFTESLYDRMRGGCSPLIS